MQLLEVLLNAPSCSTCKAEGGYESALVCLDDCGDCQTSMKKAISDYLVGVQKRGVRTVTDLIDAMRAGRV